MQDLDLVSVAPPHPLTRRPADYSASPLSYIFHKRQPWSEHSALAYV